MSLIFLDWKCPDEDEDICDQNYSDKTDFRRLSEEDITKLCKERLWRCMIPIMNLLLMAFVWTVSLNYGSVLMPSFLTLIFVVLYVFNYLEEHAIRYSISDIIHLKHVNNDNQTETNGENLELQDINQSKLNYFNYNSNLYIETIEENCEPTERSTRKLSKRTTIDI